MPQTLQSRAFTLIETMLAVIIAGIMLAMVPRLVLRKPADTFAYINRELAAMVTHAKREAMRVRSSHRLRIERDDVGHISIVLEREVQDEENPRRPVYQSYPRSAVTYYCLPKSIVLRGLIRGGRDMLKVPDGELSLYVSSDGVIEPAILKLRRGDEKATFHFEPFLSSVTFALESEL